uniref:Uncharacterized protein n=1 Tax=Schistosoma curassoni TaxID=6186 RepID=A0A183KT35_9TREM
MLSNAAYDENDLNSMCPTVCLLRLHYLIVDQ